MDVQVVHLNNTNVIEINGLRDSVADTYINDATVSLTIVDADGTDVSGVSWPVAGSYISSGDGVYKAVISTAAAVSLGSRYTAQVTVTSGSSTGRWDIPLTVRTRVG